LQEIDAFLIAQAATPVQSLLHCGSGWGWLHERRIGRKISRGLSFETVLGDEERPWNELLASGTFSKATLDKLPCSFNVSPGWVETLRESARQHGATWLHDLHLGVAELERGEFGKAREHFKTSVKRKDNAPAQRCLALLCQRDGDLDAAQAAYTHAWTLCGNDRNLAVEIGEFYARHKRYNTLEAFVKSLPAAIAGHERITLLKAQIALERGEYATVRQLLQGEYCTIREGELSLSELWFASHIKEAEGRIGRKLTPAEKRDVMEKFPPPHKIDFRMQ
jgi:hypothetical protein